ncbi:MAG: tetratricopeptide repeat protein [Planctomycetaceae bacterium]
MEQALSFEDLCRAGRKYLKAGRGKDAVQAFEAARQMNDLDPDVHENLGAAHCLLAEYEPAAKHFERATVLEPRRGAAWINLGAVLNRLGQHSKAAEVLRRAVQIDHRSAIGFYNLGIAYKHLQRWTMAIPAYREAIRLDPQMADAYLNLGNVYVAMHNFPQAISQFKKALELDPNLERAQRGLARAESAAEDLKKGFSPFGRLVGSAPEDQNKSNEPPAARVLAEDERIRDRRRLSELFEQTQLDQGELLGCLKSQLDPAVKTLNRLLTHRTSPHGEPLSKAEALENFSVACKAFAPRLAQFRRVMQQMREHEASVK